MRGTQLKVLRDMLKAELGDASSGTRDSDKVLNTLLSNKQKWLATEYDWPFLQRRWDVGVGANAQFIAFPVQDDNTDVVDINLERTPTVEVYWNQVYQPIEYGIGSDEYNTFDFSLGQQTDPIQRWRAATNPNEPTMQNTFEVWPVPVTAQTVRFTGQRALLPLAADTDTADLDDMMLVLFVAGEKLLRSKQRDAELKMQEANRRMAWVKQNYPTRSKRRALGSSIDGDKPKLTGMIIVTK
jgi:hypothetical protein